MSWPWPRISSTHFVTEYSPRNERMRDENFIQIIHFDFEDFTMINLKMMNNLKYSFGFCYNIFFGTLARASTPAYEYLSGAILCL